jgi:hypothetical protein
MPYRSLLPVFAFIWHITFTHKFLLFSLNYLLPTMNEPFIYLRALRHADHTVFNVQDGQKFYYDPQFNAYVPFSSGQQVKRSMLDAILQRLGATIAPVTFNYTIEKASATEKKGKKGKIEVLEDTDDNAEETGNGNGSSSDAKALKPKEVWSPCDPSYPDQLLGGWMKAAKDEISVKRRSPLSISAMRPLHPLLSTLSKENATFDRSSNPDHHPVRVRDGSGNVLSDEEVNAFLTTNNRTLARRSWIPDLKRASGLFVYDVALDLRTLFCVSLNQHEPELRKDTIEKLRSLGWTESKNVFGACLVCPKDEREKIIAALAHGLIQWRITSNQARTYSPMETLAVAVSDNANHLAALIRARLKEGVDKPAAEPIVDNSTVLAGTKVFVAPPCDGYIVGVHGTFTALEEAEQELVRRLQAFEYEKQ